MIITKMMTMPQDPFLALWGQFTIWDCEPVSCVSQDPVGFVQFLRSDEEIKVAGGSHRRVAEQLQRQHHSLQGEHFAPLRAKCLVEPDQFRRMAEGLLAGLSLS